MEDSTLIKRRVLSKRKGKTFVRETLKMKDGHELDWYYLDLPKSTIIIPITAKNELVLVRLYRYNNKDHFYELPAGRLENYDKNPLLSAKRELLEETGYTSDNFTDLGEYYTLPSETNKWVHIFLATDLVKKGSPKLDTVI